MVRRCQSLNQEFQMPSRPKSRLPFANLLAAVALFLALTGGVAYAGGLIGTRDIENGAVTTQKLQERGRRPSASSATRRSPHRSCGRARSPTRGSAIRR